MEHNDEGFEIVSEIKITRNSNERLNNFQQLIAGTIAYAQMCYVVV